MENINKRLSHNSEIGIALTRDRRLNAGTRMSKLLEAEDEDDFYKTTYGGFIEEADDEDYKSEYSNSDATDSDIDINEDDDTISDDDIEKKEKKTFSSVYKEAIKKFGLTINTKTKVMALNHQKKTQMKLNSDVLEKQQHQTKLGEEKKKSIRKSTAEKSKCTEGILKERKAKAALNKLSGDKRKITEMRRLTQEELLAEAKITEEINLASLETYQKMELEKKKLRTHRNNCMGSAIKFHSVALPDNNNLPSDVNAMLSLIRDSKELPPPKKCSRNFVTFTDEKILNNFFPVKNNPKIPEKQVCVVTGSSAKYLDPLTSLPYANKEAFKIIREAYKQKILLDKVENEKRRVKF
ncbi:hypothetical protein HELRODRAFT_69169 [Helobdella robusta]|uniref:Vacuolar protein sorting-associated protein 72 homolog n=1 Tax=Helobdella robusta TaxID=6412 RepID=T1FZQ4_HELRO|nr:hypothetical protein HELRODRAFT_69169 [Helobdella robusta]ESN94301.1 hypothetical protein HELRODRAFT_69169 [Helobdella robusta]